MNNEQLARKYFSVFGNNPVSIDEWDILVQQMRVPLQEEITKLEGKCNKLKGLLLLVDDSVSHFKCGSEVQLAQWEEFIKCFPEEGEK